MSVESMDDSPGLSGLSQPAGSVIDSVSLMSGSVVNTDNTTTTTTTDVAAAAVADAIEEFSATAPAVVVRPKRRSHKRTLSLGNLSSLLSTDLDDSTNKDVRTKRTCRRSAAKPLEPLPPAKKTVTKNAKNAKNARKETKDTKSGDQSDDNNSTSLDLTLLTAKSISTQTDISYFNQSADNTCEQGSDLLSQDQFQSPSSNAIAQSESLTLAHSVQECISALLLPVSADVHDLHSTVAQLQTTISQLSAHVSILMSAYSAQTTVHSSSTQHTTPGSSSVRSTSTHNIVQNVVPSTSASRIDCPVGQLPAAHSSSYARVVGQSADRRAGDGRNSGSTAVAQPRGQRAERCSTVAAVYLDQHEQIRRSRNVVISGLAPSAQYSDKSLVELIFYNEFKVHYEIKHVRRLGQGGTTDKVRPILVTLSCENDAEYLVNNARVLRQSLDQQTCKSVFLNADLTRAQAQAAYEIRCRRRTSKPTGDGSRTFTNSQLNSMPGCRSPRAPAAATDAATDFPDFTVTLSSLDHVSHNLTSKPSAVSSAAASTSAATAASAPPVLVSTAGIGLSLPTPSSSASGTVPSRLRWVMPSNQQSDPVRQQLPVVSLDPSQQYFQEPVQTISTQLQFDIAPALQHMMAYPPPSTVSPFQQPFTTSAPTAVPLSTYLPSMMWPPLTSAVA